MNIGHILQTKGSAVVTISVRAPLAEAVRVLAERNIGSLVVCDDQGSVVGILSERDFVRQLHRRGPQALVGDVGSLMTPTPVLCRPETTVDEAMAEMTRRRFRHLPVVVDGVLVGLVSIGDVVKYKIEETEREAAELREYIAK